MMPARSPTRPDPSTGLCPKCVGLGVISVTYLHDGFKTLMRCECSEGAAQDYQLPQWEWKAGKVFTQSPVDPADFKPRPGEFNWVKIDSIMKTWRQKVRWAEQHWAQMAQERA